MVDLQINQIYRFIIIFKLEFFRWMSSFISFVIGDGPFHPILRSSIASEMDTHYVVESIMFSSDSKEIGTLSDIGGLRRICVSLKVT